MHIIDHKCVLNTKFDTLLPTLPPKMAKSASLSSVDDYAEAFAAAVAAELRAQRARSRLPIAALVDRTGLSRTGVLNYLNGKRDIPLPTYLALCAAMEADPVKIFDVAQQSLKER